MATKPLTAEDAEHYFRLGLERYAAQRDPEAIEQWELAAEYGHAKAQCNLGVMYDTGQGVEQDDRKAFEWFTKAAEQGDAKAQCNLAVMYRTGQGVEQDDLKAFEWYTKAAEQGHADAQYNFGVIYGTGQGVEQDDLQAFEWYKKAAEQGHAQAQYNLGNMYRTGQGVEQDDRKAFEWVTKAAEQGDAEAQYNLAVLYRNGIGTKQSDELAIQWFTRAAEQGNSNAMNALAHLTGDETWRRKSLHNFAEAPCTSPADLEHGDAVVCKFAIPVVSWLGVGETTHWAIWDASDAAKADSSKFCVDYEDGDHEKNQPVPSRLVHGDQKQPGDQVQVGKRSGRLRAAKIVSVAPGPGMFIHLVAANRKGAVAEVKAWDFDGLIKNWGKHQRGHGFRSWFKKEACGAGRGVFKVVWTDSNMHRRRSEAARRARSQLRQTPAYHATPELGETKAMNCESFVYWCYTGIYRSVQSERVWKNPSGKVPKFLRGMSKVAKGSINKGIHDAAAEGAAGEVDYSDREPPCLPTTALNAVDASNTNDRENGDGEASAANENSTTL